MTDDDDLKDDTLKWRSSIIATRFLVATNTVKELLEKITQIEGDATISDKDKLSECKKIKQAIAKVREEIDTIKKEIRLHNLYRVN